MGARGYSKEQEQNDSQMWNFTIWVVSFLDGKDCECVCVCECGGEGQGKDGEEGKTHLIETLAASWSSLVSKILMLPHLEQGLGDFSF